MGRQGIGLLRRRLLFARRLFWSGDMKGVASCLRLMTRDDDHSFIAPREWWVVYRRCYDVCSLQSPLFCLMDCDWLHRTSVPRLHVQPAFLLRRVLFGEHPTRCPLPYTALEAPCLRVFLIKSLCPHQPIHQKWTPPPPPAPPPSPPTPAAKKPSPRSSKKSSTNTPNSLGTSTM